MKKGLIFIFLTLSAIANSQVWISHGAVWHYEWSGVGFGGFVKISYVKDTLIDSKLCNKLQPIIYKFTKDQNQEIVLLGKDTLQSQYTYVSGDTVFYLFNERFNILFNFSTKPGDSWSLGVDTNKMQCSKTFVKVDSVGQMVINSKTYRWISLSTLSNSSVGLRGRVVERIGAIDDYLIPTDRNCNPNVTYDFNSYSFSCFQDDNFPLYNLINKDCEYLLKVEDSEFSQPKNIYPVPTKGKLYVSNDPNNELFIRILTASGKEVYSGKIKSNEIDISSLNDGVYILRIDEKGKKTIVKKIIKIR